eukprot:TRINITY_DN7018_c0_g1_i1.p1 TRINITY_DN7018_c0_g1~~TRINITY_DN7018_c0_g1_i1.p1  ORF type:complete len:547 (+),score=154.50 TRINITY_DN7018_c0_g1_i1:135-1643(+)
MQRAWALPALLAACSAAQDRGTPLHPRLRRLEAAAEGLPAYETHWYNQTLDHFRFRTPRQTFRQRYLVNRDHWTGKGRLPNGCPGPILFYTGNEGPITAFWGGNGFAIQVLAPELGALLVFAEERYYGESLPFGAQSLEPDSAQFLSTEQVLADYATLITHLKATLQGAQNCPVVAMGGSYGGTLTTYMRLRYPQVVVGGYAGSAPVGYYAPSGWRTHSVDAYTWSDVVSRDYAEAAAGCLDRLAEVTTLIEQRAATAAGRAALAAAFHLCDPKQLGLSSPTDLWTDAIETIPQEDYSYAIGTLPANPVNATCSKILAPAQGDPDALLAAAAQITDMYFGYDGKQCITDQGYGGIPGGPGPCPPQEGSWCYQSCTETLHQFSARGVRNFTFSMADARAQCQKYFGAEPDPLWAELHFGGYNIPEGRMGISNMIWSNGGRDPWHGGGFLVPGNVSGSVWIFMPEGAHHSDMRGPNPADPPSVVAAREVEKRYIKQWIMEAATP